MSSGQMRRYIPLAGGLHNPYLYHVPLQNSHADTCLHQQLNSRVRTCVFKKLQPDNLGLIEANIIVQLKGCEFQ